MTIVDGLIWLGGMGAFLAYALSTKTDTAHLAGALNRCANCGRKRKTMPYSDGWHAPVEPWCAPCIRDTEGVALEAGTA